MAIEVRMPKLGLTMTEGTMIEWKKKEGDEVTQGEILYVIETEKVAQEIEAPASGILGRIVAKEGDVVPVGGLVAYIVQKGEKLEDTPVPAPDRTSPPEPASEPAGQVPAAADNRARAKVRISPVARRLAEEHGVDILAIDGTGPEGRIVKEDVLKAIEEKKKTEVPEAIAPTEEKIVPLSSMRRVIARRMTDSFQAPHFYITVEVDTGEVSAARERLIPHVERKAGVRLTFSDLLVKMVAKALEDNPFVNAAYSDGSVTLFDRIDIGLVTAVEGGLLVPVIRNANCKSLAEIAAARSELVKKARERKLAEAEMSGSTFTISNMGMYDVNQFSAILQPPEAAILAVGSIMDKPVVRDGEVRVRPIMTLTLSIDHRVLDAVMGAEFLRSLKAYVENPTAILA